MPRTAGRIEASGTGAWAVTQAGRTFSSATAAKPITRATAEKALAQFLERVTEVNQLQCGRMVKGRVILGIVMLCVTMLSFGQTVTPQDAKRASTSLDLKERCRP